jgi:hypothetical protein
MSVIEPAPNSQRHREELLNKLTPVSSDLLDIEIEGQRSDYLLWDGVDVPDSFGRTQADADCKHLCIAILILEGVVPEIASANWDGLIESAVKRLNQPVDPLHL